MTTHSIREELSLVLHRWHDVLRDVASLPKRSGLLPEWHLCDNVIFWIQCHTFARSDRQKEQLQLEALELLARLSRVDWKLWRQQVDMIWGETTREWREIFRVRQFCVGIDLCFDLNRSDRMMNDCLSQFCELVVTKDEMRTKSLEFERACALIDSIATAGCVPPPIVPCRLYQYYTEESKFDATNLLLRVFQQVITQRHFHDDDKSKSDEVVSLTTQTSTKSTRLRITHLQLNLYESRLDHLAFRYLEKIRLQGITVCDLPVLDISTLAVIPSSFAWSMQSLLSTCPANPEASPGIDAILLSYDLDVRIIPAVLSAIHDNQSLRIVRVNLSSSASDQYSAIFWSWLAFGLFSRPQNGKQHIQEMTMVVQHLSMEHVNWMQRVLCAGRPLDVLYEEGNAVAATEEWVTATHGLLVDPSGSGDQPKETIVFDLPQSGLAVIDRSNDEYVGVLLPGWGKAWVHRRDAITVPPPPSCQASPSVQSISHLSFKFLTAASTPAFLALLRLIGHGVRSLLVDALFPDTSFDDLCAQVFQMCPHLESLELERGRLASVQPLLDSYCAGTCRLRRLVFVNVRIQDGHELDPIFHALQDKSHPIVACLQELKYAPSGQFQGQSVRQETVDLALRMLEMNDQLRLLNLDFIGHVVKGERRQEIRRAFAKLDKVKLPVRFAPMAMRRRWAFLSAVHGGGTQQSEAPEKAVRSLDPGVVSVIFQFAAKCCTRDVRITMSINDQE